MTDKITTTLKAIRQCSLCGFVSLNNDGYDLLQKNLGKDYGDDTPITFRQIYESNGCDDTIWCLRAIDQKWFPLLRHFAVDCAEDVKHLMKDERNLNILKVARDHANGKATDDELSAAWDSASTFEWDYASYVARYTVCDDARNSAMVAALTSARAAAWEAFLDAKISDSQKGSWSDLISDARDAAMNSAWKSAMDIKMSRLFKYCETGERVF